MAVTQINAEQFEDVVLKSDRPIVVDFWAEWCGPCKMLGPIIDSVSEEVDSVDFAKINVDDAEELAISYNISSIPCVILFKDGKEVDRIVGVQPKGKIVTFVTQ